MCAIGAMYTYFFERIRALAPADAVPDLWTGTVIGDPIIDIKPGKVAPKPSSSVMSRRSPEDEQSENVFSPVRCVVVP
jgi:hypothetical protein